jgi:hypothetical protein
MAKPSNVKPCLCLGFTKVCKVKPMKIKPAINCDLAKLIIKNTELQRQNERLKSLLSTAQGHLFAAETFLQIAEELEFEPGVVVKQSEELQKDHGLSTLALTRTGHSLPFGESLAAYPAFCVRMDQWDNRCKIDKEFSRAAALWEEYAVLVMFTGCDEKYCGIPAAWFCKRHNDLESVFTDITNGVDIVQPDAGLFVMHKQTERLEALAHYANEPSCTMLDGGDITVCRGSNSVVSTWAHDMLTGKPTVLSSKCPIFVAGQYLVMESGMGGVHKGDEVCWDYGAEYIRKGYLQPLESRV